MKYHDFLARGQFEKQELLAFAHGNLVEDPPEGYATRLPLPPGSKGCELSNRPRAERLSMDCEPLNGISCAACARSNFRRRLASDAIGSNRNWLNCDCERPSYRRTSISD